MSDYTSVKVPKALADKIEKIADEHGYRSVSEFVIDAARRRFEWMEWYQYPMRLKYNDVCNIVGCGAYAIETLKMEFDKYHLAYWLPLCKKHLLMYERSKN